MRKLGRFRAIAQSRRAFDIAANPHECMLTTVNTSTFRLTVRQKMGLLQPLIFLLAEGEIS